jgi:transglutaminase-like putative cysteine protease
MVQMRPISTVLLCLLGSCVLHAAPVTVVRQHFVYEVSTDGTWTTEVDLARRVDEAQAVAANGQAPVQYSESLQSLEILEAYTLTKDGMRIDVPADKILTQQLPASSGAPSFSDNKLKMVIFPQVEIGATLNLRYRLKQLKPFLPGVFSVVAMVNPFMDTQAASVTVRAPEKLKLHVSSRDMQGGEVKSAVAGRREWRWTYGEHKAILPEAGALMPETFSPYAAASTLETFPALAEAYMIGAEAAAKVTPGVQKLADEITTGITDKRAQAEAIYRWVSKEIRYVAIFMGVGGYVPHLADEIIAARYGDCKDKSTLLAALLHAKGIRAMPVLIHTAATFKLPDAVLLGSFNHAINYLPEWDLFVDSTSGFAQFGTLMSALQNKQALLGGDKTLRPIVRTTPAPNPTRDRLVQRTTVVLTADGSVSGSNRIEATGSAEPAIRASMGAIPEAMRPALAKALLTNGGQTGNATLKISDARDLTTPFSLLFEFTTPQRITLPGPGALTTSFGMPLPAGAQAFANSVLQVERTLDFPCPEGVGTEEVLDLTLPPEVKITTLPKAASVESPFGSFTVTYEVKDGRFVMNRRLDIKSPRAVCTTADTAELRKFATALGQQMRTQVLYQ